MRRKAVALHAGAALGQPDDAVFCSAVAFVAPLPSGRAVTKGAYDVTKRRESTETIAWPASRSFLPEIGGRSAARRCSGRGGCSFTNGPRTQCARAEAGLHAHRTCERARRGKTGARDDLRDSEI